MDFSFTYQLIKEEEKAFETFYFSLEQVTIDQHPLWPSVEKANVKYCYFIAKESNEYRCTAIIVENLSKLFPIASLRFGPLFMNSDDLIESIKAIYNHYLKKGFITCTIQLALETGAKSDYIEYQLNKRLPITYFFNSENWSSLILDLRKNEEELVKAMSKGHKADIKKSNKLAMSVTELNSAQDFNCLMSIFENMHKKRKLNIDQQEFYFLIKNVKDFFIYKNVGKILIVKDRDGKIIGGIILAFQGSIIRYYKGASDPDYRHLPVLHLAIWESIQLAKKLGFNSFDFWGYNHFAKENDQVFLINRFKKGFGGNYLFYPKKMYFIYKPFRYKLFRLSKMLQTRFRKN